MTWSLWCALCIQNREIDPSGPNGPQSQTKTDSVNINYSIEAQEEAANAVLEVFDNTASTFIKMRNMNKIPKIEIFKNNKFDRVTGRISGDFIVVTGVYKKIKLTLDSQEIIVYNDMIPD